MALTVTYSLDLNESRNAGRSGYSHKVGLTFGDGAETYGTGIALDKAKLGCPNAVLRAKIIDPANANGYVPEIDLDDISAPILRLKQSPAVNLAVAGGAAAADTDALSMKSSVVNKESVGADTAPIQVAGQLAELASGDQPAAMTVRLEVEGY